MMIVLFFVVSWAAASGGVSDVSLCDESTDDVELVEEQSTQLLQVTRALQRTAIHQNQWDLQSILTDSPRGSFLSHMRVLVKAVSLTYNSSGPDNSSTLLGRGWERLHNLDRDPSPGGVFARVFASHAAQAAVVAFKGVCTDPHLEQCQMDQCYLTKIQNYGLLSREVAKLSGFRPEACSKYQLDYAAEARQFVDQVQWALPGYSLLLTGHSLGGMLAIVTAAQQPNRLKALTFAPTPFHFVLTQELHFSPQQISALIAKDLVATCDPYDCGINAAYAELARVGAETCLYVDTQEPQPCVGLPLPYSMPAWRNYTVKRNVTDAIPELLCKGSAHRWRRYEDLVLSENSEGKPNHLPICSTDFSVLQTTWRALQRPLN
mmetsp:Transcript_35951/g.80417  ORF Transcript_35951/g.80417 Transcript_35951/m.80417 type:complete len:377 (+) Transcript_35951:99-1229(+)